MMLANLIRIVKNLFAYLDLRNVLSIRDMLKLSLWAESECEKGLFEQFLGAFCNLLENAIIKCGLLTG
jgi:hypothetical protein